MNLETTIGLIGMLFILTAFLLDEFYKKFRQDSIQYNVFNIIGSGLLTYYAYSLTAWPFVVLNVLWFIAAGYKLVRITTK
tara:strand:+ start:187 stop:426 length:240 start_codon:yes stop_codon:yes gene_type:complete